MTITALFADDGDDEEVLVPCGRCLDLVPADALELFTGLEGGDEWWCRDCTDRA